ncbi:MAG: pyridoxal phosphate-dependent aminotransferase [Alphaproteobacteria bacterium]|nr:pyridoxal phosphate-dependent aminotransferase [Alphaproteobacteria bacterium]
MIISTSFAERLKNVKPSSTLSMTRKALDMLASGIDVIKLEAGEPDFPTPEHICQAAVDAMKRGETRYTSVDGTPQLKKAILEKFQRENGLSFELSQISVGSGGKQVISNALLATVGRGDEVLFAAPYWVSYPDMVSFCEGTPIAIPTHADQGYRLQAEALEKAITPRTKWIILNSPSNPTGAVLTGSDLRAIADVLLLHPHVNILSDDIYEHLVYAPDGFTTILQVEPSLADRTIIVNGVSKSYNMTGWRIGYGAGPISLIKKMCEIQSHLTSNPCSISQAAAVAALNGPQDFIAKQCAVFKDRRDRVVAELNKIEGLTCPMPDGAFYVYPNCAGLIGAVTPEGKTLETDQDVTTYFLDSEAVAVVHGAAFGLSPCFRISYAASMESLMAACERIDRAVRCLKIAGSLA